MGIVTKMVVFISYHKNDSSLILKVSSSNCLKTSLFKKQTVFTQRSNTFHNKISKFYYLTSLKVLVLLLFPLFADGQKDSQEVFTFTDSVNSFDSEIILSSSKSKFTSLTENRNSKDFETFLRHYNRSTNSYVFSSEKTGDVEFIYHSPYDPDSNSQGRRVIILTGPTELFAVPYKNVSLYVVLRPLASTTRFSAHFAYVRNFTKQPSVEWDIYSLEFHNPNCSVISTFFPTVKGPEYEIVPNEHKQQRKKRRSFGPFSYAWNTHSGGHSHSDDTSLAASSDQNNAYIMAQGEILKKRTLEVDGREEDLNAVTESDNYNETPVPESKINEYSSIQKLPFVGLGDCPLVNLPEKQIDPLSSLDGLVDFYLEVMRVQCEANCKLQTTRLFTKDFIHKIDNLTVEINERHDIFSKLIMTEAEWTDFSSAVIFAEFSKVYSKKYTEYLKRSIPNSKLNSNNLLSPDGKPISSSISTLTMLVLNVLESTVKTPEIDHAIKIANLLLTILQAERSDLLSSEYDLAKCSSSLSSSHNICVSLLVANFNDQLQVNALMRFIIDEFGQSVSLSSLQSFSEGFHRFYTTFLMKNIAVVKNKEPFLP